MARYRKIDPRIWNDAKFSHLSNDAKLLFIYLLTSPQTQMIGAVPMRAESVAAELGFDMERYGIRYRELYDMGIAEYDDRGLYWVKNFLKYNSPDNPKVVISWRECLDFLPECPLLSKILESARAHCLSRGERYIEAFQNGIGNGMSYGMANGMPYKEQEQEQEQEQNINNTNKQQTEVSEAMEASADEGVCCVSSCEDNFSEDEVIDAPIKVQAEQKQLEHLQDTVDETKPLTLVELITACKTFGIRLSHTTKTEAIANRKTVNLVVLRECAKTWKATSTGTGYFVGILDNASKDPQSFLPHGKREKPELSAETIADKQAGYFASRLVKDASFQSTFGVGHQSFDTFIDQVTQRLHDPEYFKKYLPWMQKLGLISSKKEAV